MDKQEKFEENYKRFLKGEYCSTPERISFRDLAKMFFEFGYCNGVFNSSFINNANSEGEHGN